MTYIPEQVVVKRYDLVQIKIWGDNKGFKRERLTVNYGISFH